LKFCYSKAMTELLSYSQRHEVHFQKQKAELSVVKHRQYNNDSKFTEMELNGLLKALQTRNAVHLRFESNVLATTDVLEIAKTFREGSSTRLTSIDFSSNRDFRARALIEIFQACKLKRLNLEGCRRIGAEFPVLTSVLASCHLSKLALFDCGLECQGVYALIDILSDNHRIKSVDIRKGRFRDTAGIALAQFVANNKTLTQLYASSAYAPNCSEASIDAVRRNTTLLSVELCGVVSSDQCYKFLDVVENCINLTELAFEPASNWGLPEVKSLFAVLERNRYLKAFLHCSGCICGMLVFVISSL